MNCTSAMPHDSQFTCGANNLGEEFDYQDAVYQAPIAYAPTLFRQGEGRSKAQQVRVYNFKIGSGVKLTVGRTARRS